MSHAPCSPSRCWACVSHQIYGPLTWYFRVARSFRYTSWVSHRSLFRREQTYLSACSLQQISSVSSKFVEPADNIIEEAFWRKINRTFDLFGSPTRGVFDWTVFWNLQLFEAFWNLILKRVILKGRFYSAVALFTQFLTNSKMLLDILNLLFVFKILQCNGITFWKLTSQFRKYFH